MIGLSPLPTTHPETFQRLSVRSSTVCYHPFNLAMGRSPSFASTATNFRGYPQAPCSDSLSLRLQDSSLLTSLVTVTRRLIMQKARCHSITKLQPLVSTRFQVLFHPGTPSPFHLSLTVLFPIGLLQCLALADGAADFRGSPSGSPLLRILNPQLQSTPTGLSPPAVGLPRPFVFKKLLDTKSYNPGPAVTGLVWASTRSLATTDAITDCFLFLRLLRCFSSAGEPPA